MAALVRWPGMAAGLASAQLQADAGAVVPAEPEALSRAPTAHPAAAPAPLQVQWIEQEMASVAAAKIPGIQRPQT